MKTILTFVAGIPIVIMLISCKVDNGSSTVQMTGITGFLGQWIMDIQGDHGKVQYRNLVLTPIIK